MNNGLMPPLSTHFRLAALVMPSISIVSHVGSFLLGTTAPDAFVPESETSFSQHHFKGGGGRISLQDFLKATNLIHQPSDDAGWSFTCGYYCHLWLDVFYGNHADRLPIRRPPGMLDTDLRNLARKETEILNAPFVLKFSDSPVPESKDLLLPPGIEFIDLERCRYLFREVIKQSQGWSVPSPEFQLIDPMEYAAFLNEASRFFLSEIQTIV